MRHTQLLRMAILTAMAATSHLTTAQIPLPSNTSLYASGLQGPRGLAFGPDGVLYVAEAGTGGQVSTVGVCTQVPGPIGPYKGGATGRISKIVDNKVIPVATGFASTLDATGGTIGVADVAFLNGDLYALIAGGGCSHGNPNLPNGIAKVNATNGKWHYITDLSIFVQQHPGAYPSVNDAEPDDVPYSMTVEDGKFYIAEPNHAEIFTAQADGATRLAIDYSFLFADVTPTSVAFRDGNMYVGNLNIFPVRTETGRVTTFSKNIGFFDTTPGLETKASELNKFRLAGSRAGFTTLVSIKFAPNGLLYALELSDATGYPAPGAGKVVRLNRDGTIDDVVTGLFLPTGMVFGPDKAMYLSNAGALPAGAGQILRVTTY